MRSLLLIGLLAVAAGGCGQNGAERVGGRSDDVRELTLLMPIGDRLQLLSFTDEVARLSDGRLRIRLVAPRHEAATDFEAQTIRDVRAGRADLGWAGARAWSEFDVAGMDALVAPLLIDSYELQERVLRSDVMTPLLRGLDGAGIVGIGALPGNM